MKLEHFNTIAEASKAMLEISSMVRSNRSIKFPRTLEEYEKLDEDLMEILRNS